jgi:hypothetical protein
MSHPSPPGGGRLIGFGPDANCTLALCSVEHSVYRYRPSLVANTVFAALFALALGVHVALGIRWRTWWFMWCMVAGCSSEIIGYAGRVLMWYNPFRFDAFMIQIGEFARFVLTTFTPVPGRDQEETIGEERMGQRRILTVDVL